MEHILQEHKAMMDYSNYIRLYQEQEGHLNCIAYITVFFNFASSCNTPLHDLDELHEKWLHQIGRNYSKNYRNNCRSECKRLIKFINQLQQKKEDKKTKTTIYNNLKEMKEK